MFGVDHDPGAQAIGHDSTGDLARRGPLQRFDHLEAVVIRQPDIKDQVHVVLRGIDVRDHGLNAGIGIRQQSRMIASHRFETIDRMPDPKQVDVALRDLRLKRRRIRSGQLQRIRHRGQHFTHAAHPATTDVRLAQQEIGDHAHHGQGDNHHDPGNTRSGFPVRAQDHADDHRNVQQERAGALPTRKR